MKKLIIFTTLVLLAGVCITTQSCKKIHLLNYDLPLRTYVMLHIPPGDSTALISDTSISYVDIDSVVKGGTGSVYGYKNISSIKLTSLTMTLANGDDSDNFANFQSCFLYFTTNSGTNYSSAYQLDLTNIPDSYTNYKALPVSTTDELKSYLIGNQFNISGGGVLRRRTTKTLNCQVQIDFNMHVN